MFSKLRLTSRKGVIFLINVYDISVKVVLTKDVKGTEVQSVIASTIDFSFEFDDAMKSFHRKQEYKNYSFTPFKPYSNDGIYTKGSIFTFNIRTANKNLKDYFIKTLPGMEAERLVCIIATAEIIPKYKIDALETLSPIVVKTEVGYWGTHYDVDYFLDRVNSSAISKYNVFTGNNIPQGTEVFTGVNFKRNKVKRNYKNIVLIGDNCIFKVKDTPIAQEIAYLAIGSGLCDMVPRGFCALNYQYKKRGEASA